MSDEPGILGNLPRSRPGQRSPRRDAVAGATTSQAPGTSGRRAAGSRGGAASTTSGAKRRSTAGAQPSKTRSGPRSTQGEQPPHRDEEASPGAAGVVTGAARAAGGAATVGVRVASRLAGEALRRLPRP